MKPKGEVKPEWLLLVCLGVVTACGPSDPGPPPPSSAVPIDAVDPEALVEGNLVVLGVRMPVGSEANGQDALGAAVKVPHSLELVSSYMRARLEAKNVETGPHKTVFVDARRPGAEPKEPDLKVIVARRSFGAEVTFIKTPRGGTPSPYARSTSESPVADPSAPAPSASVTSFLPKAPPPPRPDE